MKVSSILIVSSTLVVIAVGWFLTMNPRGFKTYLANWLTENELQTPALSCHMGRPGEVLSPSRKGYCLFEWPSKRFDQLHSKLSLVSGSQSQSPRWGCEDLEDSEFAESFISKNPPGPIISQNTSTSFLQLLYWREKGLICVDLEYPYD